MGIQPRPHLETVMTDTFSTEHKVYPALEQDKTRKTDSEAILRLIFFQKSRIWASVFAMYFQILF